MYIASNLTCGNVIGVNACCMGEWDEVVSGYRIDVFFVYGDRLLCLLEHAVQTIEIAMMT